MVEQYYLLLLSNNLVEIELLYWACLF